MEKLLAALLANTWTKSIAALFIIFEIYNIGIIPAWYGTLELKKLTAELEIATQQANAAEQRQKSEADAIRASAKIKLGEAQAAALQESAAAELAEHDATTAEQTAKPSPERQKAEASKATNEAKIQLARAQSARDQAKADADIAEQQANKMKGDAIYAEQSANAQIAESNAERANMEQAIIMSFGRSIEDLKKY